MVRLHENENHQITGFRWRNRVGDSNVLEQESNLQQMEVEQLGSADCSAPNLTQEIEHGILSRGNQTNLLVEQHEEAHEDSEVPSSARSRS